MTQTALGRRLLLLAPLGVAAVGGVSFWAMLSGMRRGTFDPRGVPSTLIGKPLPQFSLPGQPSGPGFSSADVRAADHPVLINFFASWCVPCVVEAPLLTRLQDQGAAIWGIAYKDKPQATADFLARNGNPYRRIARDEPGRVAIDFGVYGVPESYLVDRAGIIRWRWAGPLMQDTVTEQLQPLLKKYA